jgi:uncharacterized protein (DUF3084 family)
MTNPEPDQPGQPRPAPGIQQPAPSSPPKRTAVVVLTIVSVLMLGAAATFGTLWLLERDNHKQTAEQLATRDKELADEKKAHDETKSQLTAAEKAKTDAESQVTALTPCADAGKEIARLALANASEEEATQAGVALVAACVK